MFFQVGFVEENEEKTSEKTFLKDHLLHSGEVSLTDDYSDYGLILCLYVLIYGLHLFAVPQFTKHERQNDEMIGLPGLTEMIIR